MIQHALAYARIGWPVFPCHSASASGCSCGDSGCAAPGKHPKTSKGFHDATTDEATIRAWWSQWPAANIGIRTGNGLLVFDFDRLDPDPSWPADLVSLLTANTPRARSGRGSGAHVYVRCTERIARRIGFWTGVDVLGEGGYVIAPPSLHLSGLVYEWQQDPSYELAELPETLADLLAAGTRATSTSKEAPGWIRLSEQQVREIRSALACLDSSPRDQWLRMGMALKSTGAGEQAFRLWDEWSQTCPAKYTEEACRREWASISEHLRDGHEVTVRSLFGAARAAGWVGDQPPPKKPTTGIALRVDDLFTMASEEPEWLVEDLIAVGELCVIYGASGVYKTFVALDLCARIVHGFPVWGRDVKRGHVLYLPGEGRSGLRKRFVAWAQGQGPLPAEHANLHVGETLPELSTEDGYLRVYATLLAARERGEPYCLVVIDTLSWALGSGLDENSTKDVSLLHVRLRRLREEFKVSIVVIHHAGKAGPVRGPRGSSSIPSNAECVLQVAKKGTRHCTIDVQKTKEGEPGQGFEREFVSVQLGVRANGKPITSGYLRAPGESVGQPGQEKRGRGRPKGSKNKPKERN